MVRTRLVALVLSAGLAAGCGADGETTTVDAVDAQAAGEAAGCVVAERDAEGPPDHLDPAEAPPAEELYDERPPASGPHFGEWLEAGIYDRPIDERAAVHNLEHGAIGVWYDPDEAPDEDVEELRSWATDRNDAGLANRAGAGIIVAPAEHALEPPFAFRGWLVGGDCLRFDPVFADSFLLDHFGERGQAPEGMLAPDVTDVVEEG